jgi:hypothetical protein
LQLGVYGYYLMTNHVHLIADRARIGTVDCSWLDPDPFHLALDPLPNNASRAIELSLSQACAAQN